MKRLVNFTLIKIIIYNIFDSLLTFIKKTSIILKKHNKLYYALFKTPSLI